MRPEIKPDRVLFLGNSITRHGVLEKIGWNLDCGMAASALEKDYVHLVANGLAQLSGKKPEILTANVADFERGDHLDGFELIAQLRARREASSR